MSDAREISIFWDYENVPLPDGCNVAIAAKAIVDAVSSYGRIVDRRLYFDFEKRNKFGPQDSSSLDSSGFDLVNTPTRNQKETLDKKLIADVLTFAWDSAVRNDNRKPCIVLLTSDGDYAYTLSKLRDRGVMTIVMVGKGCTVASILVDTADVALSLEKDVLPASFKTNSLTTTNILNDANSSSSNNNNDDGFFIKSLCRIIADHQTEDEDWVDFGRVSSSLQQIIRQKQPSVDYKEKSKEIRKQAQSKKLISVGRRKLQTGGKRIIVDGSAVDAKLSAEMYIRLLFQGEKLAGTGDKPKTTPSPAKTLSQKNRSVFIRKLPREILVNDLVQFLQETYKVTVVRALLESNPKHCNAHVELSSPQEATCILNEGNKAVGSGITYTGQTVGVMRNTRIAVLDNASKQGDDVYYNSISGTSSLTNSSFDFATPSADDSLEETADSQTICVCLYAAERTTHTNWVGGGKVGQAFRSRLPGQFLKVASKEDINNRFKEARHCAIADQLVEMGKRNLDCTDNTMISISDNRYVSTSGQRLSPEHYLRLLPAGRKLAENLFPNEHPSSNQPSPSKRPSTCIYSNNFPPEITAMEVVDFLETACNCQVKRVELENNTWKGVPATVAHIELTSGKDVPKVLNKSKAAGLSYAGQRIFITPNRTSPDAVAEKTENAPYMSFTRLEIECHDPLNGHDDQSNGHYQTPTKAAKVSPSLAEITPLSAESKEIDDMFGLLGAFGLGDEATTHSGDGISAEPKVDPFQDLLWS